MEISFLCLYIFLIVCAGFCFGCFRFFDKIVDFLTKLVNCFAFLLFLLGKFKLLLC